MERNIFKAQDGTEHEYVQVHRGFYDNDMYFVTKEGAEAWAKEANAEMTSPRDEDQMPTEKGQMELPVEEFKVTELVLYGVTKK